MDLNTIIMAVCICGWVTLVAWGIKDIVLTIRSIWELMATKEIITYTGKMMDRIVEYLDVIEDEET